MPEDDDGLPPFDPNDTGDDLPRKPADLVSAAKAKQANRTKELEQKRANRAFARERAQLEDDPTRFERGANEGWDRERAQIVLQRVYPQPAVAVAPIALSALANPTWEDFLRYLTENVIDGTRLEYKWQVKAGGITLSQGRIAFDRDLDVMKAATRRRIEREREKDEERRRQAEYEAQIRAEMGLGGNPGPGVGAYGRPQPQQPDQGMPSWAVELVKQNAMLQARIEMQAAAPAAAHPVAPAPVATPAPAPTVDPLMAQLLTLVAEKQRGNDNNPALAEVRALLEREALREAEQRKDAERQAQEARRALETEREEQRRREREALTAQAAQSQQAGNDAILRALNDLATAIKTGAPGAPGAPGVAANPVGFLDQLFANANSFNNAQKLLGELAEAAGYVRPDAAHEAPKPPPGPNLMKMGDFAIPTDPETGEIISELGPLFAANLGPLMALGSSAVGGIREIIAAREKAPLLRAQAIQAEAEALRRANDEAERHVRIRSGLAALPPALPAPAPPPALAPPPVPSSRIVVTHPESSPVPTAPPSPPIYVAPSPPVVVDEPAPVVPPPSEPAPDPSPSSSPFVAMGMPPMGRPAQGSIWNQNGQGASLWPGRR
jgi:hypothetical protein